MALYPGAVQKLLSPSYAPHTKMTVYNRVNLHTAAGNGSLFNYFNAPNRPSSHFWVAKNGTVEQYQDTQWRAEADLEGNDATVSIETEGTDEPWTAAQLDAIVSLVDWILRTHHIPRKLVENSFINDERSRGVSWHRVGIDGNFPAMPSRYAGRQQRGGGMHYSSSFGKACPTDNRIDQIHDVIMPRLLGTPPTATPPPSEQEPTGGIAQDGIWGPETTRALQKVMGTPVDGVVSNQHSAYKSENPGLDGGWEWESNPGSSGSALIKAMQKLAPALVADGYIGPKTIKEIQRRMGTPQDGHFDKPSPAIKELQKRINRGDAPYQG